MALGSDGVLGDGVDEDEETSDATIVGSGGGDDAAEGCGGSSYMGPELVRTFVGGGSAGGATRG